MWFLYDFQPFISDASKTPQISQLQLWQNLSCVSQLDTFNMPTYLNQNNLHQENQMFKLERHKNCMQMDAFHRCTTGRTGQLTWPMDHACFRNMLTYVAFIEKCTPCAIEFLYHDNQIFCWLVGSGFCSVMLNCSFHFGISLLQNTILHQTCSLLFGCYLAFWATLVSLWTDCLSLESCLF